MMTRDEPTGPAALGLDLGSTRFKAALLDRAGRLTSARTTRAPALSGTGGRREGDAAEYARVAAGLLAQGAADLPSGTPVGIASQRSSFVLWDRRDGRPIAPLVSWQDRRAADWCARHSGAEAEVFARTGLVLSAHYAGPKLAAMQEAEPGLARELRSGRVLFGTLESWLLWLWSEGRAHETDLTMAARTSMLDLASSDWSPGLLDRFGVPRAILPRVRTGRCSVELATGLPVVAATLADQAAGALAVFPRGADCALINLGTGGFVLRPAEADERREGFLTGPFDAHVSPQRYALEGTINGAGAAVDRFGSGPTDLARDDTDPDAFCLPDAAGLGSPFWRPDVGLALSGAAERLTIDGRRRIALEGLLFRLRQVLEGLSDRPPARLLLAGGLARDAFVAPGLAALLGRPVEVLDLHEAGLIGAARLAAGLDPHAGPETTTVQPGEDGGYLREKWPRWLEWLESLLR
jgi:glycerol kinase